jgi:hypothetical protein
MNEQSFNKLDLSKLNSKQPVRNFQKKIQKSEHSIEIIQPDPVESVELQEREEPI